MVAFSPRCVVAPAGPAPTGVALHGPDILLEWELCFSFPGKYSGFTDCSLDTVSTTIKARVACSTVLKRKMILFLLFREIYFCSSFCMVL